MSPAAAAGAVGPRARALLALSAVVICVLLALLNPWLVAFAVAGFALGWLIRSLPPLVRKLVARLRGRRLLAGALVGLAAAVTGVTVSLLVLGSGERNRGRDQKPAIPKVLPVSYSARATIDTAPSWFALRERLVVPPRSLSLLPAWTQPRQKGASLSELIALLAQKLGRLGWREPLMVGDALELSREDRFSRRAHLGRLTRRATVALPAPRELATARLSVRSARVTLIAPKHWMLATSPPSSSEPLPGGREQRLVAVDDDVFEQVQVELAGPLFRSPLGAALLALSVGGAAKWGVLLVFGVLQDDLRKLVERILGRLRRRPLGAQAARKGAPRERRRKRRRHGRKRRSGSAAQRR